MPRERARVGESFVTSLAVVGLFTRTDVRRSQGDLQDSLCADVHGQSRALDERLAAFSVRAHVWSVVSKSFRFEPHHSLITGMDAEMPSKIRFPSKGFGAVFVRADVGSDIGIMPGTDVVVVVDKLQGGIEVIGSERVWRWRRGFGVGVVIDVVENEDVGRGSFRMGCGGAVRRRHGEWSATGSTGTRVRLRRSGDGIQRRVPPVRCYGYVDRGMERKQSGRDGGRKVVKRVR